MKRILSFFGSLKSSNAKLNDEIDAAALRIADLEDANVSLNAELADARAAIESQDGTIDFLRSLRERECETMPVCAETWRGLSKAMRLGLRSLRKLPPKCRELRPSLPTHSARRPIAHGMMQSGGESDAPAQATAVHLVVLSQTSPRSHGYPARMVNMEAGVSRRILRARRHG